MHLPAPLFGTDARAAPPQTLSRRRHYFKSNAQVLIIASALARRHALPAGRLGPLGVGGWNGHAQRYVPAPGVPSPLARMRPLDEIGCRMVSFLMAPSLTAMDVPRTVCRPQARRLESQLYQRAQDMRTIETSQRQATVARNQVRQLEQNHLEQAARISQVCPVLGRPRRVLMRRTGASPSRPPPAFSPHQVFRECLTRRRSCHA